ncbi:MAG: hypothetical protein ACI4D3_01020, partial [Lachnospiraceae bacterium]
KCRDTEFRYGPIKGKYVIYRGETAELKDVSEETAENVTYLNVEEYLKQLQTGFYNRFRHVENMC